MANLNKTALASASSSTFTDNTSGLITPVLHRTYNTNTIDSFLTSKDASSLEAVMLENRSSSKAAANTVDLSTADGNLVHITTGTSNIAGFGTVQAGARFAIVFDVAVTLLYNSISLILPTAANILTEVGDTAFLISEGGGNWRCVAYQRSSGAALVGGNLTLQDVTDTGNTTSNNIAFLIGAGLTFSNGSIFREGTTDAGLGGAKGVAQICSISYELKWEAGRLYVMEQNGFTIRLSLYNFSNIPTVNDDDTKGFNVNTLWTLDDGTTYKCTDKTTGAAVWVLQSSASVAWGGITGTLSAQTDLQSALDAKVDDGAVTTSGLTMSTDRILGRTTASTGAIEEIAVGSGLTLSSGTLTNTATPTPLGYYAMYQDVNIQTAALVNTGYPMLFRVMDLSNQITVISNSQITFAHTGVYNLQFSTQFSNADTSSAQDVTIWLRKNGSNVIGSAGLVGIPKKTGGVNGHILPSWNYLLDVIQGDYYEIIWSTTSTDVQIQYYPGSNPPPSTASTIFTVTQQSGIMAGTGLTALNGLSTISEPVQVFTTGTDFVNFDWYIDSTGDTHTFNIPSADGVNRGLLTAADWVTFDNKYDNPTGTTSQYIRGDGTFSALPCDIQTAVSDETTTLTTGNSKMTFRMPYAMTVTSVRANVNTAPTGSAITVDVKENGNSIMTGTKISIAAGTKTSVGSGTPVLTDTALADDSEVSIDILTVGSTFGGAGLKVTIIGTRA